jgi:Cu/Ag efflux protein CusF
MSEIPIQVPMRGAHEADDDTFLGDSAYEDSAYEPLSTVDTADIDLDTQRYEHDDAAATVPTSDVDLDSDPFADDLSKELAAAAPKRWANRATVVIGALALVVGGFLGGVQVEKHYGSTATATNAAARRGGTGFTRGEGFGGGFGGGSGTAGGGASAAPTTPAGGAGANTTTGTVKLVDGTTLYVQLANGDIATVDTTGATKVLIGKTAGKLSSLTTGEKVTVTGTADAAGTVTAKTVTATP